VSQHQVNSSEESIVIEKGAQAPDFTLVDQYGRKHSLSRYKGKKHVMLLFYPLDFTPT
jgi:peroxiredoxin